MIRMRIIGSILLLSLLAWPCQGKLIINEIQSSNITTVFDTGWNLSQWIEIYNDGSSTIDLTGYYITDDMNDPSKCRINYGETSAGKYYVLWLERFEDRLSNFFSMDMDGGYFALFDPEGELIDSVSYPRQFHDVSYGRITRDGNDWAYYAEPTPGETNNTTAMTEAVLPENVQFSLPAGFYSGTQSLELSSGSSTGTIRYTEDGSWPTETSDSYEDPIEITENSVIRASLFEENMLPGKTTTQTYLIDEEISYPVVSISTEPDYFYGNEEGIYVKGTNGIIGYCRDTPRNWNNNWERPINFEYFSSDGAQQLNQMAGTKIFGGCSRIRVFKSLSIYARNQYGNNRLKTQFFRDKDIDEFKTIILRNSGNDAYYSMFRDAFMQSLLVGQMDIDLQSYQPAVIFINGEYKGMLNVREKTNEHYPASNYDIDADEIDMLEKRLYFTTGEVISGSGEHYADLIEYMDNHDLGNQEYYDYVCTQMDVNEFMNYYFSNIYFQNEDWPANNVKYWRPQVEGGKWRWVLFDTDFGWALYPRSGNCLNYATYGGLDRVVIKNLLENDGFKHEWIQRMAGHINTTFDPARVTHIYDSILSLVEQEIYRHIDYWKRPEPEVFESNTDFYMPRFTRRRPDTMRLQIKERFRLSGMYDLSVDVNDPSRGFVRASEVKLPPGFTGSFYRNVPLRLTAIPKSGYRFSHWEGESTSTSSEIFLDLSSGAGIQAVFEPAIAIGGIYINEVSASAKPYIIDEYGQSEDWIEVYNDNDFDVDLAGWYLSDSSGYATKYKIPSGFPDQTTVIAKSYLVFWSDNNDTQGPLHTNFKLRREGEFISLVQQLDNEFHVVDSVTYSEIHPYLTLGRHPQTSAWEYLVASPNALNRVGEPVDLRINEYMAKNEGIIMDEYGESEDWIEIYNPTENSLDVGGMFITDSLMEPLEHMIPMGDPSTIIPPGGHLVLWADNQPEQGILHLGFKLSGSSEQIGLYQVGSGYVDSLTYEIEYGEAAFGSYPDGSAQQQYLTATPGAANDVRILDNIHINEFMASNQTTLADEHGEYDDWIEIYNGNSYAVDIGGLFMTDSLVNKTRERIRSNVPDSTTIPAGGYLVLWADNQPEQGVLHLGFKLTADGEQIGLIQPDGMGLLDTLSFSDIMPDLPVGRLADGSENLQYVTATPGASNQVRILENIYINEFMASNQTTLADEHGEYDDWIEIYNGNSYAVDIGGLFMTDSLVNKTSERIRSNVPDSTTIPAGGYLVMWADNQPEQGVLHLGFKLTADGEQIGLIQPDGIEFIDSLSYSGMLPDMAKGRIDDGSNNLQIVTSSPAASNYILPTETLYISEIVASGNNSNADEYGEYDDWIEIHNDNDYPVDIGGLFLTDSLGDMHKYYVPTRYPDSTVIQAGGKLVLWLDGEESQGILHVGFQLKGNGEQLALVSRDGSMVVDSVSFPNQYSNFSYSRLNDTGDWKFLRPTFADMNDTTVISGIVINEFSASNSCLEDEFGEMGDWIELHNTNSYPVDIGGLYLTDSIGDLTKYRVPSHTPEQTVIPAGDYYLIYADNNKDQGIRHTNFGLSRNGEQIGLIHYDESTIIDSITYTEQFRNSAYGRLFDTGDWYALPATPGAMNDLPDLEGLVINEVMTDNKTFYEDNSGEYDDWIEIFNGGSQSIDVGGLYIADTLDNSNLFRISTEQPDSTTVASGGHLVLWADNDEEQGVLHLGFKISRIGEQLGLFGYLGEVIDSITVPLISPNTSWGRTSDADPSWVQFAAPTPQMSNIMTHNEIRVYDDQSIVVYPNPMRNRGTFKIPVYDQGRVRIEIFDAKGSMRSLLQEEYKVTGTLSYEWDVSDASGNRLPGGMYLFRIYTGESVYTGKFLVGRN